MHLALCSIVNGAFMTCIAAIFDSDKLLSLSPWRGIILAYSSADLLISVFVSYNLDLMPQDKCHILPPFSIQKQKCDG